MTKFYETCNRCDAEVICDCPYCEPLLAALKEIAKGEGKFNRDPLTHANNTIENMINIAQDAIKAVEANDG